MVIFLIFLCCLLTLGYMLFMYPYQNHNAASKSTTDTVSPASLFSPTTASSPARNNKITTMDRTTDKTMDRTTETTTTVDKDMITMMLMRSLKLVNDCTKNLLAVKRESRMPLTPTPLDATLSTTSRSSMVPFPPCNEELPLPLFWLGSLELLLSAPELTPTFCSRRSDEARFPFPSKTMVKSWHKL